MRGIHVCQMGCVFDFKINKIIKKFWRTINNFQVLKYLRALADIVYGPKTVCLFVNDCQTPDHSISLRTVAPCDIDHATARRGRRRAFRSSVVCMVTPARSKRSLDGIPRYGDGNNDKMHSHPD
jgi:hypothetical protein